MTVVILFKNMKETITDDIHHYFHFLAPWQQWRADLVHSEIEARDLDNIGP
jgi:hypothetical protein